MIVEINYFSVFVCGLFDVCYVVNCDDVFVFYGDGFVFGKSCIDCYYCVVKIDLCCDVGCFVEWFVGLISYIIFSLF